MVFKSLLFRAGDFLPAFFTRQTVNKNHSKQGKRVMNILASSSQQQRIHVWSLYRNLIKYAKLYPSSNRDKMVIAIKEEFRDHRNETDEKKLERYLSEAEGGLQRLQSYSKLNSKDANLNMSMT